MSCKWQSYEMCNNTNCPYCASFCPMLSNDIMCRYRDSDNPKWEIEVLKYPTEEDWILCKKCTLVTIGKDAVQPPTLEWKKKLLAAEHSPIRTLQFCFKLTNIPYWVSTHLVRHVHAIPFVKSQRNDRQTDYDRKNAPQDTRRKRSHTLSKKGSTTTARRSLSYRPCRWPWPYRSRCCRRRCSSHR